MPKTESTPLARTLEEVLCDPALFDTYADLIDYDQRWGGRSPKGPPPVDAVKVSGRAYAAVRDAVATRMARNGVPSGSWLNLDDMKKEGLWMALVPHIECCRELVASLRGHDYYQGFSVEKDLPFLARMIVCCLQAIEAY